MMGSAEDLSAEESGRYSRGLGDNYCHEITSSDALKFVVP